MWRRNFALATKTPSRHSAIMVEKHPKRPRDLNQWAKRMVDIATGETTGGTPPRTRNGASFFVLQFCAYP
jgi:hypothetical protein